MPARRPSSAIARHSLGLARTVPEVVAHRVLRMWLAGPTPSRRDRAEFTRMGTEKIAAFHASWVAMAMFVWRANLRLAWSPWWWTSLATSPRSASGRIAAQGQRIALEALGRGMAPWHQGAAANAARLRRARRPT